MRNYESLSDELVYDVCEKFIRYNLSTKDIADEVKDPEKHKISREEVYAIVREGLRRKFVLLFAPVERELADRISDKFALNAITNIEHASATASAPFMSVVPSRGRSVMESVATEAATLTIKLIREIAEHKKKESRDKKAVRVHVAFAAGASSKICATTLAAMCRTQADLPPLALHAISSGFDITDTSTAPATFFQSFEGIREDIQTYALYSAPFVRVEEYKAKRESTSIAKAVRAAEEVDIVVTGFASATDEHGELRRYIHEYAQEIVIRERKEKGTAARSAEDIAQAYLDKLHEARWTGDCQRHPFNDDGPLMEGTDVDLPFKAMGLFELPQLAELAKQTAKAVVVVCSPCIHCNLTRKTALQSLLQFPKKARLFSHLVMDIGTAEDLLGIERTAKTEIAAADGSKEKEKKTQKPATKRTGKKRPA